MGAGPEGDTAAFCAWSPGKRRARSLSIGIGAVNDVFGQEALARLLARLNLRDFCHSFFTVRQPQHPELAVPPVTGRAPPVGLPSFTPYVSFVTSITPR